MVLTSTLVLPDQGEDIRLSRKTPFFFSFSRSFYASASLFSKTLFFISISFILLIFFSTHFDVDFYQLILYFKFITLICIVP